MSLKEKDRVLFIKLFYQNGNLSTALHEYRRLNYFQKGSMSRQALKKMIKKFEEAVFRCDERKGKKTNFK